MFLKILHEATLSAHKEICYTINVGFEQMKVAG